MSQTIEIIVSPKGETKIETKGFTGAECRQASEFIEKALGQRTNEQLTPESHHQVGQQQKVEQEITHTERNHNAKYNREQGRGVKQDNHGFDHVGHDDPGVGRPRFFEGGMKYECQKYRASSPGDPG